MNNFSVDDIVDLYRYFKELDNTINFVDFFILNDDNILTLSTETEDKKPAPKPIKPKLYMNKEDITPKPKSESERIIPPLPKVNR